jgi:DNA invertase Pin-like site-specific DNA recombinase
VTLFRRVNVSDRNSRTIRAVAYWRMSSSPQEKSIPQQRAEMLPRARLAGVEIVAEFKDEAVSGGGMKKRDAFREMVRFCEERRRAGEPVEAVVCYHTNRFSRADSNETGAYIWQLRQAGVNRLLTWERWYDFRKEEDRAIFNLSQDFTNNKFLRDLSAAVLRGRKDAALAGFFAGGSAPYGFDRVLLDERGEARGTFRRGERFLRPRGWHVVLAPIPEDDPDPDRQLQRQTVLWLFDTFHRETVSYRWLAEQLNLRQVPGSGSGYRVAVKDQDGNKRFLPRDRPTKWTVRAVADILKNPAYRGVYRFGAVAAGKYHRLAPGDQAGGMEIVAAEPGAGKAANADGLIFTPMECGGYVGPEVWEAVQKKVAERARLGLKPRRGGYTLPGGILYCGHCGHRMYGCTMRPRSGGKVYEYRKYVCSAPNVKPGVCRAYSIDEDAIVKVLVDRLEQVYLSPERLAGLEAALEARAEAKHAAAPAEADRLRSRLDRLELDIVRSRRRVLQAEDVRRAERGAAGAGRAAAAAGEGTGPGPGPEGVARRGGHRQGAGRDRPPAAPRRATAQRQRAEAGRGAAPAGAAGRPVFRGEDQRQAPLVLLRQGRGQGAARPRPQRFCAV